MDESLVTISEAAKILGVSEVALRHWTDEGRVKAFVREPQQWWSWHM